MDIKVLDHGYIRVIDRWGSDEAIIEAARMSTGKGFLGWGGVEPCTLCYAKGRLDEKDKLFVNYNAQADAVQHCSECKGTGKTLGDERLLAYLYKEKHATPFEMAGLVIEVQAPIFVFREWHRHRTQSYNEMSARYIPLPDVNYIPTIERLMLNSKTNKQASRLADAAELTESQAQYWVDELANVYDRAEEHYQEGLKAGIPKELARIMLPVGRYSRMRASANLRNWLAFLTLRMDEKAQWEIRQYANEVGKVVAHCFPRTWALFQDGRTRS